MSKGLCVYPGCIQNATQDRTGFPAGEILWCIEHWGFFPHECETYGCDRIVRYDDEPYCFTHSPDDGSSVPGYSAYKSSIGGA